MSGLLRKERTAPALEPTDTAWCLQGQLVSRPQPHLVRPVADRDPSVQMLMNRHHTSSQAVTPACLWDLKGSPSPDPAGDSALTRCPVDGRYGKLSVELRDVTLSQELVASVTVRIWARRNSCGSRSCQVRRHPLGTRLALPPIIKSIIAMLLGSATASAASSDH